MERRMHTRHRANTRVYIRTAGKPVRMCKAVNLSAGGVAVATEDMALVKGSECELTFAIDLGQVVKVHRRQAHVTHVRNGITGFSMAAYETRAVKVAV